MKSFNAKKRFFINIFKEMLHIVEAPSAYPLMALCGQSSAAHNKADMYMDHKERIRYTPHYHSHFCFYYVPKGKCYINIEGRRIYVAEKSMIILQPHQLHEVRSIKGTPFQMLWASIDVLYCRIHMSEFLPNKGPVVLFGLDLSGSSEAKYLLERVTEELQSKEHLYKQAVGKLMAQFFIVLLRNVKSLTEERDRWSKMVVKDIMKYVEERYVERIALDDLAAFVSLSPSYLSSLFKRITGTSVVSYINSIRVEKAKELLNDSKLRINDVAERVGFEDTYYFSRIFKKLEGLSPLHYRNALRKISK
ncbi:MAG: AraC family transcriptional regulator [bacterium]